MARQLLSGTDLEALDYHLVEFFAPGERVQVILGVDNDVSDEQLASISGQLSNLGLNVKMVQIGSTPEWPYAVQMVFNRPPRSRGIALIPLALAVKESFSRAGVTNFSGWRMT